jgi:hypothetical protein
VHEQVGHSSTNSSSGTRPADDQVARDRALRPKLEARLAPAGEEQANTWCSRSDLESPQRTDSGLKTWNDRMVTDRLLRHSAAGVSWGSKKFIATEPALSTNQRPLGTWVDVARHTQSHFVLCVQRMFL